MKMQALQYHLKHNQPKRVNKKMTLMQIIALQIAFFDSVRNIPQLAMAGYSAILWMILAVIVFVIPMGFMAAELATGWSKRGGPEVWVKEALGKRCAFITAWCLWTNIFFGMVVIGAAFSTMIAFMVGNPVITTPWMTGSHHLAQDPVYLAGVIIFMYWALTIFNLFVKNQSWKLISFGTTVGIYIPIILLLLIGGIFIIQSAVTGNYDAINHIPSSFFPSISTNGSADSGLQLFSQIMWIFIGLEIASTRANQIENPKKNYPLSLFIVLILMTTINLALGFIFSAIVPAAEISLAGAVILPFEVVFKAWNVSWLTNVLAGMMSFGMLVHFASWMLGPSNAMLATAREGTMPKFFQKTTKNDSPIVFMLIQASCISIVAILFVVLTLANLSNVYGILLNEIIILYCIAYLFMMVSYIVLKYKKKDVERGFVIPWGNKGAWLATIVGLCGVTLCIILCFFQPQDNLEFMLIQNLGIYVAFTIVLLAIPMLMTSTKSFKTNAWYDEQKMQEAIANDD